MICTLLLFPLAGAAQGMDAQPNSIQAALEAEANEKMGLDPFFSSATVSGKPGRLLSSESTSTYELPPGVTATRFLYVSRNYEGHSTIASAVLLVPPGSPPQGGWPLVLWLHGTTGVAQECGPSVLKHMGYYASTLSAQGFAVVAPDYAGLSTPGSHEWLSKDTNAADGLYALRASQTLRSDLSYRWVAIGHSQGGLAAWGLAEQMADESDPGYSGAIAVAPGVGGLPMFSELETSPESSALLLYFAYAIKHRYPDFDLSSMLTAPAMAAYSKLTEDNCLLYATSLSSSLATKKLLQPGWMELKEVQEYSSQNRVGSRPIASNLLVIAGSDDAIINQASVKAAVERQCTLTSTVSYLSVAAGHDDSLEATRTIQLKWIKESLQGQPGKKTCGTAPE